MKRRDLERLVAEFGCVLVSGRRHWHVRLGDRLVAVVPHGTHIDGGRSAKNLRAAIRRAAREHATRGRATTT